jgi:phage tail-like protein
VSRLAVTQNSSIAHLATDPLRNFKFLVTFLPPGAAAIPMGFMSVSGLNLTIDVIAYREGGYNTTTQKLPGQADFSPITLSRGVALITDGTFDYDWVSQLFTVAQGTGTSTDGEDFRWSVLIQILDHPVTAASVSVKAEFLVYNAWPTSIAWSDLDAGANQLFISQLVLAHEGFQFSLASGIGAVDAADLTAGAQASG